MNIFKDQVIYADCKYIKGHYNSKLHTFWQPDKKQKKIHRISGTVLLELATHNFGEVEWGK